MGEWIRNNVLGLIAIFIALSGTAVATQVTQRQNAQSAAKKVKRGPPGPQGPAGPQGPVGPLTGGAGGDLSGTYPDPQIASGAVGATEIADFSIGTEEFAFDIPWARATRTFNQVIPDITDTTIEFNGERFDSAGLHDNTTDNTRLTAPVSGALGMYYVTAQVAFATNATGTRTVSIVRDGTALIARETQPAVSGTATTINLSTLAVLGGGSYLEVVVFQNSGGPLGVLKSDEFSPEFSMIYLPSND